MLQYCKWYLWERNSRTCDCISNSYFVNGNSFAFSYRNQRFSNDFSWMLSTLCDEEQYSLHNHSYIILLPVVTNFFKSVIRHFHLLLQKLKDNFFVLVVVVCLKKRKGLGRYRRFLPHLTVSSQRIELACLFVTLRRTSPSATWQESHCDLL